MSGVPVGEGFWIVRQGAAAIKSFSTWAGHAGIWWRIYENLPPKSARRANHFGLAESTVKSLDDKIFCFTEIAIGCITCASEPT
jgi:hypothetical protein